MGVTEPGPITRRYLLDYILGAARPRGRWQVGMEMEKMARHARTGEPIPYSGSDPSVLGVLEFYRDRRGGESIWEASHLVGLDGPWGTITLEPGGQVEWSSRPYASLDELGRAMREHLAVLRDAEDALGLRWLDTAVDPVHPVESAQWVPKARYNIMRPFLGARGRLAHRMMTQTASIQCAFDYADETDWARKFKAAATLAPVATALFANSSDVEGKPSGYRSYRQAVWRETDPQRCGLPPEVFRPGFGPEAWLDWVISVPTIFRHRARGLVPSGGVPFSRLMEREGCEAIRLEDWETHASTIFTEVRSYTYIEVRTADLQPDDRAFSVPAFWTGILYHEDSLDGALALGSVFGEHADWDAAMEVAAREGLDGRVGSRSLRELASEALSLSARGLATGEDGEAARSLALLAGAQAVEFQS